MASSKKDHAPLQAYYSLVASSVGCVLTFLEASAADRNATGVRKQPSRNAEPELGLQLARAAPAKAYIFPSPPRSCRSPGRAGKSRSSSALALGGSSTLALRRAISDSFGKDLQGRSSIAVRSTVCPCNTRRARKWLGPAVVLLGVVAIALSLLACCLFRAHTPETAGTMDLGASLAGVPHPYPTMPYRAEYPRAPAADAHMPGPVSNQPLPLDPLLIKLHYGDSLDIQQVAADGTVVIKKVVVVDDRAAAPKVRACMLAG